MTSKTAILNMGGKNGSNLFLNIQNFFSTYNIINVRIHFNTYLDLDQYYEVIKCLNKLKEKRTIQ